MDGGNGIIYVIIMLQVGGVKGMSTVVVVVVVVVVSTREVGSWICFVRMRCWLCRRVWKAFIHSIRLIKIFIHSSDSQRISTYCAAIARSWAAC
jgi:hypothetical protein